MEYQYPFSQDWTTDEVIDVVKFFQAIEKAYEKGIVKTELMEAYRRFKEIVPSKADEKKYCNEFEESSGYSSYKTIQKMKAEETDNTIKMNQ
ncbi:UPF0223 family protein [Lederbergia citrea]|uniref:UPF0223 protein KHA91_01780 n=1 Tax=Lederbergia citrea TaxID=2833581 RepID=A0A942UHD3_9BACI|nr:UPF0223 family protein [Lederbergia citrea]MBS4177267.1 UPF0223 family protein [Lederbergia citrea]MBS4203930.1 UPF0223 family protein [Lederbergia citrea]MBS4221485.1 UPF0223 family protein [Lederbergia citrea]